MVEEDD